MQMNHSWVIAHEAWGLFVKIHPELGYREGRQQFYNFLRYYKDDLVLQDAMRRARGKFWIAHKDRFAEVAFDLASGAQARLGVDQLRRVA
jgi:hypothetical protein